MRAPLLALLASLVLVLAGCDESAAPPGSPGPSPDRFVGVPWTAISIRGLAPVPGHEPSIRFAGDRVQGSGGCNGFSGGYHYDERTGAITFDQLAMTAMGCVDPRIGQIEGAFSDALNRADHVSLDADGRLHLTGPAGEIVFAKVLEG